MRTKERGDFETVWSVIVIAFVALLIIGSIVVSIVKVNNNHQVTFTVNKSERVCSSSGKSCRYLIFTNNGVYENTDSLWKGKWNSSDLYNQIQTGKTYKCDAIGFRLPLFSWYENVIKCEESK